MVEPETRLRSDRADRLRSALIHILLIAAYVGSGRLGLLLAVAPGYASAIFPPAGIAVAAMLIRGPRVLPSTFVGAFLLNAWIGHSIEGALTADLAAAAVIAAASTMQAAIGGTVLRRAIGYPMALDTGHDLFRFLLLSPACCVTSASLSLSGLWALGAIGGAAVPSNWVTWWVGDTLGIVVVLPLMMVVGGEPRPLWRGRALPMAVPMLLFFGVFVAFFIRVSAWEDSQSLVEFQLLSQQTVDRVLTRLEEQEIFLSQLQRSFSRDVALTRPEFPALVRDVLQRFPMIRAVAWAPLVDASQRAAFEAAQQAASPGFRIREFAEGGPMQPAGARAEYYPITFIAPFDDNKGLIGLDLLSGSRRQAAAIEALKTGTVVATGPIHLVEEAGQPGFRLLLPVRGGADGPGLVMMTLRVNAFMRGLLPAMNANLTLRLVDVAAGQVLYDDFPPRAPAALYRQGFDFGQRHYEVQTSPSAFYLKGHHGWQSWALLAIGVFGIGLLGALLMLGTGYTNRIERQIEQRTGDLAAANRRLRVEIDERRNVEAALRHAQRMEAIGRLTGGIAHDFNNLLTVISANAELIHNAAADPAMQRRSDGILRAAGRGERLTRQLLAFSRRSTLRPEPVDLRQRTAEMAEMLSRSTNPNIEVSVAMPEDLWWVAVDPAEFELAVLNLAVNARDAMPNGGRLHVTARNATIGAGEASPDGIAGDFVALTLTDTGSGMTPETLGRAFEPYFTTKEVGAGSGLGLSQVYGFATQSGGSAAIASELGAGTAVTLFLPRTPAGPAIEEAAATPPAPAPRVKILVVEDEDEIAELTATMLGELGYAATHVRDAAEALAAVAADPSIGLVLSDIVMPGETNGLDLARTLRLQRPALPVLLMTGYSQYGAEVAGEAFELLEKPYRRDTLVKAVRAAIAGRAVAARGSPGTPMI